MNFGLLILRTLNEGTIVGILILYGKNIPGL